MDSAQAFRLRVLMSPWLAYGHTSPYLELAKKLSKRNFSVYFCSTPVNLVSVKKKLSTEFSHSIELVELHLPSLPELPPHYHTTNGLPHHLTPTLMQAFHMASPTFSTIVNTLKPDLIIYDTLQPWVPALAASFHIPAVHFQVNGAASTSFLYWASENCPVPPISSVIFLRNYEIKKMSALADDFSKEDGISQKDGFLGGLTESRDIILINSCREIEGKYIDFLSLLTKKKVLPVGPLVQEVAGSAVLNEDDEHIMQWLSKKDRYSTVFVCFGSEYFLSTEDMKELAHGLELSNVNFVWVVRFPVGEEIRVEEALPEGFLDRVRERGMVVEGWAPQVKILGHPSVGGFVSHCGWNSTLESLSLGVPIIAMPMLLDQPLIARLMAEIGVGMEVVRDEDGDLRREEVAKVIKEVIVEKNGENIIRKKAREMSEKLRILKGEEKQMDGVVEELTKLCEKINTTSSTSMDMDM